MNAAAQPARHPVRPRLRRQYPDCTETIYARAAQVRLACFDVDGTLTDGRLVFDSEGRELKAFHAVDGMGLALLRKAGVRVAFITARVSQVALNRARELGVDGFDGVADKLACVDGLCRDMGIDRAAVAFMGDDLPDLAALRAVGLAVIPANAHPWVWEAAHWQTRARGGAGAARELCDLLLSAQGRLPAILGAA